MLLFNNTWLFQDSFFSKIFFLFRALNKVPRCLYSVVLPKAVQQRTEAGGIFLKYILFPVVLLILAFLLFSRNIYADTVTTFDWYWVFYEEETRENYSSFTIRPFFMRNVNGSKIFEASLMPLVYWKYQSPGKSDWKSLFGLAESVDYTHSNGVRDYDFGVFPFLLYGSSEDRADKYLHIWPFGGTVKGKLGQDRITTYTFPGFLLFFVFPPSYPLTWTMAGVFAASLIPLYVDYRSRDYKAFGILWPVIQRGKSPTRDDIRIMPFYAHNYKKNTYDNYSFLMIFNYQRVFLKDDEERTFFAFPFFGRRWNLSSVRGSGTLLWPFFSWGYDLKRDSFELNFPWPFVQIQTCKDPKIRKRIFFPFWGIYEFRNNETFFVTPLYFSIKKNTRNYSSEYYINFLVIWYFKREYNKEPNPVYGTSWRYFKIWPLFQYEYDDRGNVSFNMLSLLPFRDREGYEKLYQPFWTLFEYRRLQSGEKRLGLLLRLYYQQWGEDFIKVKMPLLFSVGFFAGRANKLTFLDHFTLFCYNNDEYGRHIGMLFSMFCYNNDRDGNYIRLFWIPVSLGKNDERVSISSARPDDNDEDSSGDSIDVQYGTLSDDIRLINNTKDSISNNITLYTGRVF